MKRFILILFLILVPTVYAGESPTLLTPANNSSASSSTLNWQAPSYTLYSTNPYRVQVDDDSSFSSINKDYYTKNTFYSPVLNEGTWYWRVKAKDLAGNWSDWSSSWSFNLQSNPSPSTAPTPSPSPTPSSSSSSSSTSSGSSASTFTISNTPSQINSDQSFNVSINLSLPDNPNTNFYLKGAFKKADSSNYFGLTKVSGSWIKNNSSYSNQYPITTDSSGNWSGTVEIQPDSDDSGFTGTNDYIFKVGRYTSSGSGPTWSNESTIKITATSTQNTVSETSSKTSGKISNPSVPASPSQVSKINTANSSKSKNYDTLVYHSASIAGVAATATPSTTPSTEVKSQKQINFPLIIGIMLVIGGIGSLSYVYLSNRKRA